METAALPLSYTPVRSTDDEWRTTENGSFRPLSSVIRGSSWSLGTELNRRPPDSHSGVLTTELPQGLTLTRNWCRWVDLNNRPSPYESAALPLSYTGVPPHGFEPRLPHSKCGVLPLDEGGAKMVRPRGFEPLPSRLKGERPGPLDEGRMNWSGWRESNSHLLGGSQRLCL